MVSFGSGARRYLPVESFNVSKYCNPPITTIYQDKKELAFKSSELLLNLINEETVDSKKDIIIPIKLIKRKTT